ncbi:predicted phosphoribosyltransferase [Hahella chejuensis KCTC 2396]|uniref:Predicted phosphoribosyltransferase n=1 Tax=Hahella chejuensis (strain KCTC 2396) TaxID=349521 RepID=Q2SP40_HAHCH|nr:phosphoribosyltransferase family protein [Hahella chejuensis]ABC27584.1 predicted phosphoribosyltransferase [Hahella chejuensis KCTC 2396]
MELPIKNRTTAGRMLAQSLISYRSRNNLLILALPRGGAPVAREIASALAAPLDLLLVRKLGAPMYPELAMGAIASGGAIVMNDDVVNIHHISEDDIAIVREREEKELRRRDLAYRGDRPMPEIKGRCVIVVDDGMATGATMKAGVAALRGMQPERIVVAIPVAPRDTVTELKAMVDEVVCLDTPEPFYAIGGCYTDFGQTSDKEVTDILQAAWAQEATNADEEPHSLEKTSWTEYCRQFSHEHHGWLVSFREEEPAAKQRHREMKFQNLPLQSLDYDEHDDVFQLSVLDTGKPHEISIFCPKRLAEAPHGASSALLQIDTGEGGSILLGFSETYAVAKAR